MEKDTQIKLFEDRKVRSLWDPEKEEWFFSVVDVVAVLTDSANPNNYWKVLKNRLKKEGSQLVTDCNQLKMPSSDGKFYKRRKNEVQDRKRSGRGWFFQSRTGQNPKRGTASVRFWGEKRLAPPYFHDHRILTTESSKGINICLVWEIND